MIKTGDIIKLRPIFFRYYLDTVAADLHRDVTHHPINRLKNKLFIVQRVVSERKWLSLVHGGRASRIFLYNKVIAIVSLQGALQLSIQTKWATFVRRPVYKQIEQDSFDAAKARYAKLTIEQKYSLAKKLMRRI